MASISEREERQVEQANSSGRITISAEEVEHGVAELWAGGQQIAYTVFDDGELTLRFEPRHDGSPVVVGVRSLTDALAEVERVLA